MIWKKSYTISTDLRKSFRAGIQLSNIILPYMRTHHVWRVFFLTHSHFCVFYGDSKFIYIFLLWKRNPNLVFTSLFKFFFIINIRASIIFLFLNHGYLYESFFFKSWLSFRISLVRFTWKTMSAVLSRNTYTINTNLEKKL